MACCSPATVLGRLGLITVELPLTMALATDGATLPPAPRLPRPPLAPPLPPLPRAFCALLGLGGRPNLGLVGAMNGGRWLKGNPTLKGDRIMLLLTLLGVDTTVGDLTAADEARFEMAVDK